jgi:hypothetical protein
MEVTVSAPRTLTDCSLLARDACQHKAILIQYSGSNTVRTLQRARKRELHKPRSLNQLNQKCGAVVRHRP